MATRRVIGIAAVVAGGVALWRMMPRSTRPEGGTLEVPWPLGMGSRVKRARHRLVSIIGGEGADTLEDLEGEGVDADRGTVAFDWAFDSSDAEFVTTALGMEGIPVGLSTSTPPDRDLVLVDKLESAGIHLDQESGDEFTPIPRSHIAASSSPRRLARAIERALDTRHGGIIVDTSREIVEVDEHHEVGRGNVLLIDAAGQSRLLRHGSMRTLVAALAASAVGRNTPMYTGGMGDEAQASPAPRAPAETGATPDLTQLPPTADGYLREISGERSVSAELTGRLAAHLGAQRHCLRCNAPIIEVTRVAEALARHYGAPHRRDEIAAAIATSDMETGHPQAPDYCHQHGAGTASDVS